MKLFTNNLVFVSYWFSIELFLLRFNLLLLGVFNGVVVLQLPLFLGGDENGFFSVFGCVGIIGMRIYNCNGNGNEIEV